MDRVRMGRSDGMSRKEERRAFGAMNGGMRVKRRGNKGGRTQGGGKSFILQPR